MDGLVWRSDRLCYRQSCTSLTATEQIYWRNYWLNAGSQAGLVGLRNDASIISGESGTTESIKVGGKSRGMASTVDDDAKRQVKRSFGGV